MRRVVVFSSVAIMLLLSVVVVMAIGEKMDTELQRPAETETILEEPMESVSIDELIIGMSWEEAQPYLEQNAKDKRERAKAEGTYVEPPAPPQSLYQRCYAVASEEQKAELDAYRGPFGGSFIHYPRKMRTIIGELSENAPRLTLEQAEEVIQEVISEQINRGAYTDEYYYALKAELRELAEIDYDGGSGVSHTYFCLNDAMTQYIDVCDFGVRYYDTQEDICVELWSIGELEEFTSVVDLIQQGAVPPIRED